VTIILVTRFLHKKCKTFAIEFWRDFSMLARLVFAALIFPSCLHLYKSKNSSTLDAINVFSVFGKGWNSELLIARAGEFFVVQNSIENSKITCNESINSQIAFVAKTASDNTFIGW
jgi:hypothetical protein